MITQERETPLYTKLGSWTFFSCESELRMAQSKVCPTHQNLDQPRVTFIQLDGMPLDVWYTFGNRSEAEAFAKQVHEADCNLRPEITVMDMP
jgi:hypothetical protein